ncbi:MAG: DEAD/DEAH box helicase family protein, partial [Terriglobia bacterium]
MALHPQFPGSPYAILDPAVRWFPADETLRETSAEKLMPPLVPALRRKVKDWRDGEYADATATSRSLLRWWFLTPHLMPQADGMAEFQYYFAQREAIETIVYLYDVVGVKDKHDLMRFDHSGAVSGGMFDESWRRFVIKMATGSGKTKVLSLALAWSFFHKTYEPGSDLARNFLVIAPNIIVLDRIRKDFDGLRIFLKDDPILPENGVDGRNWRDDFQLTLHVQDDVRVTRKTGNIFLTNIHRVYAGDDIPPSPDDDNTMDYFLGPRPTGATTDSKVDLGMIVRDVDELMVLNDEAHHIHDPKMAWFKSIEDIHNRLLQKDAALSLQVDVTATPRHDGGAIFVQTVADYPLVEAIAQNVVKHPVLPDAPSRAKLVERQSAKYTEKYADYIDLGVVEWRKAYEEHEKMGKKAILFVMTDDTRNCDDVAEYLRGHYPDLAGDATLVIHTNKSGEISESTSGKNKEELDRLREQANSIDSPASPAKAIVSVMML